MTEPPASFSPWGIDSRSRNVQNAIYDERYTLHGALSASIQTTRP